MSRSMNRKSCTWTFAAPADRLETRSIIPARVAGHDLILLRENDRVWACQRLCPHEYADLLHGRVSGTKLFCGRHFASFDLDNGASGNGWHLPRLKIYAARFTNSTIEVDIATIEADPPMRSKPLGAKDPGQ
jgi:3-phenylpropionate/trans-cinnamate dioxygenase ferredoxin component